MRYQIYAHRFADIILNSDYAIKQEIDEVTVAISLDTIIKGYEEENERRKDAGKRAAQGKLHNKCTVQI
jgi:hypothetical protein